MNALLAATAMLLANTAHPFPTRAGECGWVQGRFSIYNGSGIQRIWVIGTTHMLAMRDNDNHYPRSVQRLWDTKRFVPFDTDLFGTFRVCARERWIPGHMQHIRFEAARHLIITKR